MALIVDHQPNFKHYCKICKKGFGCGRALGGHMRAHGIGDESGHIDQDDDDDDTASDWEDKLGGGSNNNNVGPPINKRMYALRANPNRLKSCRVCENCGKEFLSWKSFLEHGKCSSSDQDGESLVSSHESDGEDHGAPARRGCGWSKRKRSLRYDYNNDKVGNFDSSNNNHNNNCCPSSEEEDLANCLMMLSNATVDPLDAEPEESCASASKDEERRNNTMQFIPPVACRVPILGNNNYKAKGVATHNHNHNLNHSHSNNNISKGLFECKACKKVFNSHQALGGHRASHKKVKGCFAARLDHMDDSLADDQDRDVITHEEFLPTKSTSTMQFAHGTTHHHIDNHTSVASSSRRKSKVHECSICHRVFSSGQALGGHKRCHWITSNSPDTSSLAKFQQFHHHTHDPVEQIQQRPKLIDNSDPLDLKLDLNLPAPELDDHARGRTEQLKQQHVSTEVSTDIHLQPWIGATVDAAKEKDVDNNQRNQKNIFNDTNNISNDNKTNNYADDDEADSKVKLAKLSELKDMDISGGSSPWLQVGIGSTTDPVEADP